MSYDRVLDTLTTFLRRPGYRLYLRNKLLGPIRNFWQWSAASIRV
jgi:hypothetical protein